MKKYQPLTQDDRTIIYTLCKENYSKAYIGRFLGRSTSTITREVKRNSGEKGYRYKQAQMKYEVRKSTSLKSKKWTFNLEVKVKALLHDNYSPEQISNRLYLEQQISISHERIYQFIRNDRKEGGESPDSGSWKLLLTLDSTSVPFYINFGDSEIGYAFISENGEIAKFVWQCA